MKYLRKFTLNGIRDSYLSLVLSTSRDPSCMDPSYAAVTIINKSCENGNLFLRTTWDTSANLIPELLARKTEGLRSNICVMALFHVFYRQICTYSQTFDICLSFGKSISGNLGSNFQVLCHMDFLCCMGAQKSRYKVACPRNEEPRPDAFSKDIVDNLGW